MRRRLEEEQLVSVPKDHEAGTPTAELCQREGVREQTLCHWKRKHGGLEAGEAWRLKALDDENARLRRLVAEQALDVQVLKRCVGKRLLRPATQREAVRDLQTRWRWSERRACRLVGISRSSMRYRARERDDVQVRLRLRQLAGERRRFGYRRLHVLLQREGLAVNNKGVLRIYR